VLIPVVPPARSTGHAGAGLHVPVIPRPVCPAIVEEARVRAIVLTVAFP
jgi:hypothetical protein